MRHKYPTRALVVSRSPLAEAGMHVILLTHDLGLVRARAEGVRRPGAKLAHALQSFCESDVTLVRGREGWRLSGALLVENHFGRLSPSARGRAARVAGLLVRLVHGEALDEKLFPLVVDFLAALPLLSEEEQDAAECLAALRLLGALGLDSGELPPEAGYPSGALELAIADRRALVTRINRGIMASGL